MAESDYYENPELWKAEWFTQKHEVKRFETCHRIIPPSTTSMLDGGCGNGAFLAFLEAQNVPYTLRGLERSQAAREAKVCRAEVQDGSMDALPFDDASFDLVGAMEVIEHLPFGVYEKSLSEIQRVAARHILITVPYRENRSFVKCPYCSCKFNPRYHLRSFDDKVMKNIFSAFRLTHLNTVEVDDYIFGPVLRSAYGLVTRNRHFLRTAVCPQCGFSQREAGNETVSTASRQFRNQFRNNWKARLPQYQRSLWYVALYERKDF